MTFIIPLAARTFNGLGAAMSTVSRSRVVSPNVVQTPLRQCFLLQDQNTMEHKAIVKAFADLWFARGRPRTKSGRPRLSFNGKRVAVALDWVWQIQGTVPMPIIEKAATKLARYLRLSQDQAKTKIIMTLAKVYKQK
jgi:hypothetical protein